MNVLVFNVGSTTLKYALIDPDTEQVNVSGLADRIGQPGGDALDHVAAGRAALEQVGIENVDAIGHRIVQGGGEFAQPAIVNDETLRRLRTLDSLAPLHNPPARLVVEGIAGLRVPQVLVFDTAYFAGLSPAAYRYAVPENWYRRHGVRRYGFHGTSHQFVTEKALEFTDGDETSRVISLHLGGGASATASIGGRAIDTSMGMTPLEGLVMATRTGDLDPAIVLHMAEQAGMTTERLRDAINRESGLVGLCGDQDMRAILKRRSDGDPEASLAIDIYVRRIIKTVGGYVAVLGGLDVLIFTAGVGEHSAEIRRLVCDPLKHFGIEIVSAPTEAQTMETNDGGVVDISVSDAAVRTLVVKTNEELAIARLVHDAVKN